MNPMNLFYNSNNLIKLSTINTPLIDNKLNIKHIKPVQPNHSHRFASSSNKNKRSVPSIKTNQKLEALMQDFEKTFIQCHQQYKHLKYPANEKTNCQLNTCGYYVNAMCTFYQALKRETCFELFNNKLCNTHKFEEIEAKTSL